MQLIRQSLYYFGGLIERSRAKKDLQSLGRRIEKDRRTNPTNGVLVSLQFIVLSASPEATGSGNAYRYVGYLYGKGRTMSEARQDQLKHGLIRQGTRSNENYKYQPCWFPPKIASGVAGLRRPFPVVAHGCFMEGKVQLEDVKWTTLQGFDDEGKRQLAGSGKSYYFDILQPPKRIVTSHGATGLVKLPIVTRPVGMGNRKIPVIDLDTFIGSVTAAMIFPADERTALTFQKTPATQQKPIGTIRGVLNFDRIRWARPENIRLLNTPNDRW